jgi:hypothetical protein
MIARELPPDEVLASWQHVEQRALDLRAAGVPGTLQELRVRAFLDLLQERDARPGPGTGQAGPGEPGLQDGPGDGGNGDGGNGGSGPGPQDGPAGTSPGGAAARQPGTGASSQGPSLAALVTITVPLATLLGQSGTPGEAGGFGLLDPGTTQDLVDAAARSPATRWCVTALHPDGTAAAHACAPGRHRGPRICGTSRSTSSSVALAIMPRPTAATGPAANCSTWSPPETPDVPPRAATGPQPAAT